MQRISGIYIIYFNTDNFKYYIGQSVDIHTRLTKHRAQLRNNTHPNYKLQAAYNKYGETLLVTDILQTINTVEYLDTLEVAWIAEFDSYRNGYNCHIGGSIITSGKDNSATKYNSQTYIDILMLLANTELSAKQISDKLNVTLGVVQSLAQLKTHIYLKKQYPKEYSIIEAKYLDRCKKDTNIFRQVLLALFENSSCVHTAAKLTGASLGTVYGVLYGNSGKYLKDELPIEYNIVVINRCLKSTSNRKSPYPDVIDPEGNIVKVTTASHICNKYGLDPSTFSKLLNSKLAQYRGWRLHTQSLHEVSTV